ERKSRGRARLKFLLKDLGLEVFRELLIKEQEAIPFSRLPIPVTNPPEFKVSQKVRPPFTLESEDEFNSWSVTNLLPQKQQGFKAVGIRVKLGDFQTWQARELSKLIQQFGIGELRLTLRQDILIPFIAEQDIPYLYQELKKLGFAEPGYNKTQDITACPGTDTCNLGIASSTGIASVLEEVITLEYPHYINNSDVVIKISGCMNACGQHNMAHIGFQGMSVRTEDKRVSPALQVLLGGANLGDGKARFADKVIKIPSKRGPEALRLILDDYDKYAKDSFHNYYLTQGEKYFYDLLKPLARLDNLEDEDFIDWGNRERYKKAIGIGECAGVVIDLVATLLFESEEKMEEARKALKEERYAAGIYYTYAAMVNAAKAMLTSDNVKTNSHAAIIRDFDEYFVQSGRLVLSKSFADLVLQINKKSPSRAFASSYIQQAEGFLKHVSELNTKYR
ncbi:MAG: HEPN domain-containing protein, partial [Eudoraea sp.]|nr:HEPN domain-containing protein [Eudoraea sp.]